jgi:hypothetical protein
MQYLVHQTYRQRFAPELRTSEGVTAWEWPSRVRWSGRQGVHAPRTKEGLGIRRLAEFSAPDDPLTVSSRPAQLTHVRDGKV